MFCDILKTQICYCDNGIWKKNENDEVLSAFTDEMQEELLAVEDGSWWFDYRAKVILGLAHLFFDKEEPTVDIGGGNGYTTVRMMRKGFNVGLIEPNSEACKNAKNRGLYNIFCGEVSDETINDNSIQQCMLLDVLEHIPDDEGFLKLINNKQADNGYILLTVPAHEYLWSSEDDFAGHHRRYDKDSLTKVLIKAGYNVEYISYFFWFLIVPIFVMRVLLERLHVIKKRTDRDEEELQKLQKMQFEKKRGLIDKVLRVCEDLELKRIISKKEIGMGASLICVAKKKDRYW